MRERTTLTQVLSLDTGEYTGYSCSPEQAVVAAHEQSKGNWNTWTYPAFADHPEASRGTYTVSCGNFAAISKIG